MEKILDKIIFTFVSIYFFKNKLKILTDQIFLFFLFFVEEFKD